MRAVRRTLNVQARVVRAGQAWVLRAELGGGGAVVPGGARSRLCEAKREGAAGQEVGSSGG